MVRDPDQIIRHLGMQAHPEGGYYVETFRDQPDDGGRGAVTCIYYLLKAGDLSAWHRIDAHEIWQFVAGDPLALTLSPNGHDAETHQLGQDLFARQEPHVVIRPHWWQTAESLGRFTLSSVIVAPAFAFEGFELAAPDWRPTPRS